METPPTADAYLSPYRDARDTHGSDFGVTLWASRHTQQLRFRVFTEMIYLQGKRLLDAGCSRGDLAAYLLERGITYGHYTGVDGLAEVIDFARSRALPNASFVAGDLVANPSLLGTGGPQIIAISGTLNTMDPETAMRVLEASWAAASEAVVFNFLSDRAGPGAAPQTDPARRLPTMRLIDWALDKTWDVQFRQDYFAHGHDATILLRKPQAGPERPVVE